MEDKLAQLEQLIEDNKADTYMWKTKPDATRGGRMHALMGLRLELDLLLDTFEEMTGRPHKDRLPQEPPASTDEQKGGNAGGDGGKQLTPVG